MNVLDLFSGIGGFSLGLERAGMRTVAFCECDPYCQHVLRQHWPDVPVFGDIRGLTERMLPAPIDVICGGFPCQDISVAGKGAGLAGERSGLWKEFARIIGEVRPRYALVENVSALAFRGLGDVLGDLAALGYDAEWHCIPASAVGAPHRRDRIWIIATDADRNGEYAGAFDAEVAEPSQFAADATINGRIAWRPSDASQGSRRRQSGRGSLSEDVSDADSTGRIEQRWGVAIRAQLAAAECADWWRAESNVGRVAHGIPARVDRLKALGNAVVPQITEIIGRAIMQCQH